MKRLFVAAVATTGILFAAAANVEEKEPTAIFEIGAAGNWTAQPKGSKNRGDEKNLKANAPVGAHVSLKSPSLMCFSTSIRLTSPRRRQDAQRPEPANAGGGKRATERGDDD
jgi:hypothetical protein